MGGFDNSMTGEFLEQPWNQDGTHLWVKVRPIYQKGGRGPPKKKKAKKFIRERKAASYEREGWTGFASCVLKGEFFPKRRKHTLLWGGGKSLNRTQNC